MPTLMANYQKNLAVTRLKHFTSMMQQAWKMTSLDDIPAMDKFEGLNPDDTEKFVKIYIEPYVKILNINKLNYGVLIELANGSGAYYQKSATTTSSLSNLYVIFCPEYKYCKDIDDGIPVYTAASKIDGKHTFALYGAGTIPREYIYNHYSRDELLERCKTTKYYCSSLIEYDGWTIAPDYPW